MNSDELKALRRELGMTQAEFGEWLTQQVNAGLTDGQQPFATYTRQRVHSWEAGRILIPAKVELALLRRELADKNKQIASLKAKRRQRQSPS